MRQEKQYLLDEIKDGIEDSELMMVMSYQTLNANQTADFRKELHQVGASMLVVKKRVFLKAAEAAGYSMNLQDLAGHIGLVFSKTEAVAATKAIYKFRKDNENTLEVLGGHFQKQLCSSKDLEKISKLPSLDQMRSEFLGTLEAVPAQTLAVVEALLTSVVYCLENKANQGE
ncbi:MAG: 50S ribosomal protein L10 [Chlamydiae bacterium]|nr:50S ribosomal protein L10 [Chlamydiota bacterium]